MEGRTTKDNRLATESGQASPTAKQKGSMAKNHYVTKPKRRNKNSNRKDPSQATMMKLRERATAEAKKSAK